MPYIPGPDGKLYDEGFMRLAEVVRDYDHNLELRWIPPDKRTREDKRPYVIIDTLAKSMEWPDGTPVIYALEQDTPEGILARLFQADNTKGNVLGAIEANNRAVEILAQKKRLEELEEAQDKASFMFHGKNWINMGRDDDGKLIRYDDQRNRI